MCLVVLLAASMRSMKECEADIARNHEKTTSCNEVLEMFICIKIDAECNETTHAIAFDRSHEDSEMFTKLTSKSHQNCFRNKLKREVRQESKTYMGISNI